MSRKAEGGGELLGQESQEMVKVTGNNTTLSRTNGRNRPEHVRDFVSSFIILH